MSTTKSRQPPKAVNNPAPKVKTATDKTLTTQQLLFVKSMAKGNNVSRAALDAGYTKVEMGYQTIRVPAVKAALDIERAKYEEAAQMDRRQVMEGFKEAIEMAKLMSEPASMIAGWREIGKMCGYYAPVETKLKVDITGNVTMTRLTQMSDAELLELIERGAQNQALPAPDVDQLDA